MKRRIHLAMKQQPDDYTCGPTCLHSVYNYYSDPISLDKVISEVPTLEEGGTLGVLLGIHALLKGYGATIYTYNLNVFDPTWFDLPEGILPFKLEEQMHAKSYDLKLVAASKAYIEFLGKGGTIRFKDLNANLIRYYLKRDIPILTGLSSTYLYRCMRERDAIDKMVYDDIRGDSTGHFVVLSGYDLKSRTVQVADPYSSNPRYSRHYYKVRIDRLINAILLGILTYDANLLVIEPTTGV